MEIKYYVEWLTPGSFFPEESTQQVESKDLSTLKVPRDVYAFSFHDIKTVDAIDEEGLSHRISTTIDVSPRYIIGEVFTVEQIKEIAEALREDYHILISNVEGSDFKCGIRTHLGNWQCLEKDDIVLSKETITFTDPVLWRNLK